jgi:hypothetical protein
MHDALQKGTIPYSGNVGDQSLSQSVSEEVEGCVDHNSTADDFRKFVLADIQPRIYIKQLRYSTLGCMRAIAAFCKFRSISTIYLALN